MRFMLWTTYLSLKESTADAHAAELKEMQQRMELQASLHRSQLELWKEKVDQALDKIVWLRKLSSDLLETKVELLAINKSQQDTIKTAMSDLVILKGAGRVRHEQPAAPGVEIRSDVEVTDEHSQMDTDERRKLLKEAIDNYEKAIAGLDLSKVSAEEAAAAMPANQEEWNREHAQPETEHLDPVPPELRS